MSPRARLAAPFIVFTLTTLVAWWAIHPYLVGVYHDDGVYAMLARSLASGGGFHYANLPGAPAATHYPPLYPLLLAGAWRIWPSYPGNVAALVHLNAPLIGVAAVGWWYVATRYAGLRVGVAGRFAIVCCLTLPTLVLGSALLSETLFLALLWPALVLGEHAAQEPSLTRGISAGLAVGVLMLVRTHAVALVAALTLVLLFRREYRVAAASLVAALVVQVPWLLFSAVATPRVAAPLQGSYGSYLGWFFEGLRSGGPRFAAATARLNLRESWLYLADRVAAGYPYALQLLVAVLLLALFALGLVAAWPKLRVTVLFIGLYLAIVVAWPYSPWRFEWAIWPLVLLFVVVGAAHAWTVAPVLRPVAGVGIALLAFAMVHVELDAYRTRAWRLPALAAAQQVRPLIQWAHAHVGPEEFILAEGEPAVALNASVRAAPPVSFTASEYVSPASQAEGRERLSTMLRTIPSHWVLLMAPNTIGAADQMRADHPGLERVGVLQGAAVYRVTP